MNVHPNPQVQARRWLVLPVLCISLFMVVVDNLIINVALPTLSTELGASTSGLQWIVDSYALVFACLLLAFGALGDRLGRKGMIQFGMVAFVACSVWASFAIHFVAHYCARCNGHWRCSDLPCNARNHHRYLP
jgi:MFS family permease